MDVLIRFLLINEASSIQNLNPSSRIEMVFKSDRKSFIVHLTSSCNEWVASTLPNRR